MSGYWLENFQNIRCSFYVKDLHRLFFIKTNIDTSLEGQFIWYADFVKRDRIYLWLGWSLLLTIPISGTMRERVSKDECSTVYKYSIKFEPTWKHNSLDLVQTRLNSLETTTSTSLLSVEYTYTANVKTKF